MPVAVPPTRLGATWIERHRWRAAAVAALAVASACAPATRWENAAVPRERWRADAAECRARATSEVEAEWTRRQRVPAGAPIDRATAWDAQMARFDAGKRRGALFAACMKALGYRKVRVEPDE